MKEKKERDWKFIIGMVVLIAIFAVMGGAFWNMVGKQAQIVKDTLYDCFNALECIVVNVNVLDRKSVV